MPQQENQDKPRLKVIHAEQAPAAIGPYSQAVVVNGCLFTSGQIGIDPVTSELCGEDVLGQARQIFENLNAIAKAAGASLSNAVKLNVYLTDLTSFQAINELMAETFKEPYPARACLEVSALPKGALIEVDAIFAL